MQLVQYVNLIIPVAAFLILFVDIRNYCNFSSPFVIPNGGCLPYL